jgi:hypothetical protein
LSLKNVLKYGIIIFSLGYLPGLLLVCFLLNLINQCYI